ncbi:MAG: glycosyltransferase [Cytophagaceae bacterium SCN 52-12]|nr:MAG: glycosyltransferase [Cytophagaceae bacterium SCN 52-12]
MLARINCCVIIPTYNNARTLKRVLEEVWAYSGQDRTIVINDGATDATAEILEEYRGRIIVLENMRNRGKGYSLRRGFREAIERGFDNAITIDSDGQHFADDIPAFVKAALEQPGSLVMGSRNMDQEGVPGKSAFGNKFSSFWFWFHTGIKLPDTQTGYRLYPLAPLKTMRLVTEKFETEIEVIVKMAWRGVRFASVPVRVKYDPDERVSHFRPFRDFSRISLLNTWFFLLTLAWYLPRRLLKRLLEKGIMNTIRDELFRSGESEARKAASVGFGLFMGIVPIWGFQLMVGIPAAIALRLNKILFFLAANISIPPMIPVIVYASYKTGEIFFSKPAVKIGSWKEVTLQTIHLHFVQYAAGAVLLACLAGLAGFLLSYLFLRITKR